MAIVLLVTAALVAVITLIVLTYQRKQKKRQRCNYSKRVMVSQSRHHSVDYPNSTHNYAMMNNPHAGMADSSSSSCDSSSSSSSCD